MIATMGDGDTDMLVSANSLAWVVPNVPAIAALCNKLNLHDRYPLDDGLLNIWAGGGRDRASAEQTRDVAFASSNNCIVPACS